MRGYVRYVDERGFHIGLNLGECVGVCVVEHLPLHIVPQAPDDSPAVQAVLPEAVNALYAQIMLAQKASVALIPLIRVTYVSAACHPFTEAELCELLLHAKTNNSKGVITGLLLYHRMSFFQILEGTEADVTAQGTNPRFIVTNLPADEQALFAHCQEVLRRLAPEQLEKRSLRRPKRSVDRSWPGTVKYSG